MSVNGHFRTLKIKSRIPAEGEIYNENWQNCLFFDNEKAAVDFCEKLKNFITKEYPRALDQKWF